MEVNTENTFTIHANIDLDSGVDKAVESGGLPEGDGVQVRVEGGVSSGLVRLGLVRLFPGVHRVNIEVPTRKGDGCWRPFGQGGGHHPQKQHQHHHRVDDRIGKECAREEHSE